MNEIMDRVTTYGEAIKKECRELLDGLTESEKTDNRKNIDRAVALCHIITATDSMINSINSDVSMLENILQSALRKL